MRGRIALAMLFFASTASARPQRRFEPNDLNLTPPGLVEIETQVGYVAGHDRRWIAPDVEASLGIADRAEIEIDTTYGVIDGTLRFVDQTWVSARIGVVDVRDDDHPDDNWALGVQIGPRLPTAPLARALGVQALVIGGRNLGPLHAFGSAGPIVESYDETNQRPTGLAFGVDVEYDLNDVWTLTAQSGALHFVKDTPDQLQVSGGITCGVRKDLDLTLVGLYGPVGDDRWGVFVGVTPRFSIF